MEKRRVVLGILAHVDAGKTTLSESLLYQAHALRTLGRVDHGDAFLDTETLERERGITIFSKQALFSRNNVDFTLLDTPGHVDFSAEAERVLRVLDCAVLVISATDGVQSHTRTLWKLLAAHRIPTFLFVNKTDLPYEGVEHLLAKLKRELDDGMVDCTNPQWQENAAVCDEAALELYLQSGTLPEKTVSELIAARKCFPCFFGTALKNEGVDALLDFLAAYAPARVSKESFGAQVFKISRDAQGNRLTWMKITGGTLQAKMPLSYTGITEKADQLRLYSGAKFTPIPSAEAGTVVAVTGLGKTYCGQGIGTEKDAPMPTLTPVLSYRMCLPEGVDAHTVLPKLRELEEEDPLLRILWEEQNQEIRVQLMGEVQIEILQRILSDRFALAVTFDAGDIVYRETIASPVEGIGHFEPLRHYAEVHLLLEPLPRGSGLQFAAACPFDTLEENWQRLVLTHLAEREHRGVLLGAPVTDLRITLASGKAHVKHTSGGDFRQATYRAVRQGLMQAESILLEPYYDFTLLLPPQCVGRAINDIQMMGGTAQAEDAEGGFTLLRGHAPVAKMRHYGTEVSAYTRGLGQLSCTTGGFEVCRNAQEIIASSTYDAERDTENPADSVFCDHGSGVNVKWSDVPQYAHLKSILQSPKEIDPAPQVKSVTDHAYDDNELQAIFENTYGKVERKAFEPPKKPARTSLDGAKYNIASQKQGPEYLLVDGYNIIFAWDELKALAEEDIAAARGALIDMLSDYQGFRKCVVILVFDAYRVKGNHGTVEKINDIYVVYTKEAETADTYIERATYDLGKEHRVRVATSDALEQTIILGHGALRISARLFREEVEQTKFRLGEWIERHNAQNAETRTVRRNAILKIEKND